MHDAQHDGGDDRDDERHGEKVYDELELEIAVVRGHDDGAVLARHPARELGPDDPVDLGKVAAVDVGRVAAALDVDQEHGLFAVVAVGHVNVRTAVEIAGAALATRGPRTVEHAGTLFAARRRAQPGGGKVGAQR